MTIPPPLPKVNFFSLYHRFKKKVIGHFLITALWVVWNIVLFGAITELFRREALPSEFNYAKILIPEKIHQ
jgi:hypothetical protein